MNQRQAATIITYAEKILLANVQSQGVKPMHTREQVQSAFDLAVTFAETAQSLWNEAVEEPGDQIIEETAEQDAPKSDLQVD